MKFNKYSFDNLEDLGNALKNINPNNLDFLELLPKEATNYEFLLFNTKSDLKDFVLKKWEKYREAYIILTGSLNDSECVAETFVLMLGKIDSDFEKVVLGGCC